jgi:hypothetical protein
MKMMTMFILALTMSFHVQASIVHLNSGESITLTPNSQTTVTCSKNTPCTLHITNLQTKLDYCRQPVNPDIEGCLDRLWPEFKKFYGSCTQDAFQTCLNFCKKDQNLDCLDICI